MVSQPVISTSSLHHCNYPAICAKLKYFGRAGFPVFGFTGSGLLSVYESHFGQGRDSIAWRSNSDQPPTKFQRCWQLWQQTTQVFTARILLFQ